MRKRPEARPAAENRSTFVEVPVAGILPFEFGCCWLGLFDDPPGTYIGVGVILSLRIVIILEPGVGVGLVRRDFEKKILSRTPPKIGLSVLFFDIFENNTPKPMMTKSKIRKVIMTFRASPIACSIPHFFILDKLFGSYLYFEDMYSSLKKNIILASANTFLLFTAATKVLAAGDPADVQINEVDLGFKIPNFSELMSFMVRFFFVMAGLAALFYMLWGAFSWVISGGESEAVEKARGKITSAIIGMLVIVATLAIIWSLENIVFKKSICFGISCPITLPNLLECVPNADRDCN